MQFVYAFNLTWKSWNYFCIMYSCNTLLFLWENILLWYSQASSKWLHLSEMMYFTLNCNIASHFKISTLISLLWQHKENFAFGVGKWAGDNIDIFLKFSTWHFFYYIFHNSNFEYQNIFISIKYYRRLYNILVLFYFTFIVLSSSTSSGM